MTDGWTTLNTDGRQYAMVDLPTLLGDDLTRLPYALRVLAENAWRHQQPDAARASIGALRAWAPADPGSASIDLMPDRLLMHDTTSTPALVDLAAMRDVVARDGYDPDLLQLHLPTQVSVDHSVAVEAYATPGAVAINERFEMRRNRERFAFHKWAAQAMPNLTVNPPGTGIMHTMNLEQFATVATVLPGDDGPVAAPDFMLGTDSHTPTINALGVLAWGIGGLEAEMIMLGIPTTLRLPPVVGVRLTGRLAPGTTATDFALVVTARLRQLGVTGALVEFFGPGVGTLSVGERIAVANMAPEYGATTGYFPIDEAVPAYLRATGRDESHIAFVEAYAKAAGLWRDDSEPEPVYTHVLEVDLGALERSAAGPRRPQDRLDLGAIAASLQALPSPAPAGTDDLPPYPVTLAAITSCTNTSDPRQLIAAGLLARKARALGLKPAPWVKTSLAPGSPAAARYLERAGLTADLDALGFGIVGFGCTTCIGNSGPLPDAIAPAAAHNSVHPVAIVSSNRNFPGRVGPTFDLTYLVSTPVVIAYAIAGDASAPVAQGVFAHTPGGDPVRLEDVWPSAREVDATLAAAADPADFPEAFAQARASTAWADLPASGGAQYAWDPHSTILAPPAFVTGDTSCLLGDYTATPLLVVGDDVTTDHISPASAIPPDSFIADFLVSRGEDRANLNVFASRRGDWEVMLRGGYYNRSLVNHLGDDLDQRLPVGHTLVAGSHEVVPIFEVAARYRDEGRSVVVVAGERYGMGSSRDWAAKVQRLLGVRAVLAASYERIHRSNLVGMGILPLVVGPEARAVLAGMRVDDTVRIEATHITPRCEVAVTARIGGQRHELSATAALDTDAEVELLAAGGAIPFILRRTEASA